jgi:hypothetical protein
LIKEVLKKEINEKERIDVALFPFLVQVSPIQEPVKAV